MTNAPRLFIKMPSDGFHLVLKSLVELESKGRRIGTSARLNGTRWMLINCRADAVMETELGLSLSHRCQRQEQYGWSTVESTNGTSGRQEALSGTGGGGHSFMRRSGEGAVLFASSFVASVFERLPRFGQSLQQSKL